MAAKNRVSFRLSDHTLESLDRIVADVLHTDEPDDANRTSALEYAVMFAGAPAGGCEHAEAILGKLDAQRVAQHLAAWSALLLAASEDNSKVFTGPEWCLIADVCNGTFFADGTINPVGHIAANVADGHSLDGTGYKWLADEGTELEGSLERVGAGKPTPGMKAVDKQVRDLVQRIASLDAVHGWAMVAAVQWFWDHCSDDVPAKSPWWTVTYRRRFVGRKGPTGS